MIQFEELHMHTNCFQLLSCVFGINVVDLSLQLEDFFRLDGDISGLTLDTQQHSVNWLRPG